MLSNKTKLSGDEQNEMQPPQTQQNDVKWTVRKMTMNDIERCLVVWEEVGLSESHSNMANYLSVDPDGFYVAQLEPSGRVIGMLCAVIINNSGSAFVGLYGVDPKYQGIGVGKELWRQTLARPEVADKNIGLYAVPEMAAKYKGAGFVVEDSVELFVYKGLGEEAKVKLDTNLLANESQFLDCELEQITAKSSEKLFGKLVDYDAAIHKFSRRQLLSLCFKPVSNELSFENPITVAVVRKALASNTSCIIGESSVAQTEHKLETDNDDSEIVAYGCIMTDNTSAAVVGPLYANSSELAELVFKSLLEKYNLKQGQVLEAYCLSSNTEAMNILSKVGLQVKESCSRLFTKFVPPTNMANVFCIHTANFSVY